MEYSIGEIAQKLNLATSTLRYYDNEGLLPFIKRKSSGVRIFNDSDLAMLRLIECLKNAGMSIKDIKQFSQWCTQGDLSLNERYQMFLDRKENVLNQIKELEKSLELIEYKCWYYETAIKAGSEDIHKKK